MIKSPSITEDQLDLMQIIQSDGNTSQRQITKKNSIGKVNYCLKALMDIGFIKIDNFNKSDQKLNYACNLTSKGMQEKAAITKQFITKKKQEYDKLYLYVK
mgnify:CR=1 FL=1